ncbi:MAG: histidine kinase N-terminal 7TM domain-containing protein [bacterium]
MAILFPYFELAAALFILFIAFETIARYQQDKVGRFFAFLALIAFLSSIFEYSVRIAMTMELAQQIHRITGVLWAFLFPAFTHFCLLFTRKEKVLDRPIIKALLYGPPFLVAGLFLFTNLLITRYEIWSIGIVYQPSPWYWLYFLPSSLYVITGVLILLFYGISIPTRSVKKKQAYVIASGTALALLIGATTDEILPLLFGQRIVFPTGPFMLALMFGFVYYAMRRYSLFHINPFLVAETIIETMPDSLIVTDLQGRVQMVNEEAHKYFRCPKKEIVGKPIQALFMEKEKYEQLYEKVVEDKLEIVRFETKLCDPRGECLPSLINANVYRDPLGMLLGIIFIIRDTRG